jgi:hypothetical protein
LITKVLANYRGKQTHYSPVSAQKYRANLPIVSKHLLILMIMKLHLRTLSVVLRPALDV